MDRYDNMINSLLRAGSNVRCYKCISLLGIIVLVLLKPYHAWIIQQQQQQHVVSSRNYNVVKNNSPIRSIWNNKNKQDIMLMSSEQQRVRKTADSATPLRKRISSIILYAIQDATFGMGCFWKPSEELLKVDGVINTIVGYTGNPNHDNKSPPSYEQVCFSREPWVEGIRVQYDDTILSYEQLLYEFYNKQEPAYNSRQYSSVIFTHNNEQYNIAKQWYDTNCNALEGERGDNIPVSITSIESLSTFYQAEQYHQRYWQKTRPRIACMILLLVLNTSAIDQYISSFELQHMIHTSSNAIVIAGMLYILFERKIDTKTIKLE